MTTEQNEKIFTLLNNNVNLYNHYTKNYSRILKQNERITEVHRDYSLIEYLAGQQTQYMKIIETISNVLQILGYTLHISKDSQGLIDIVRLEASHLWIKETY